MKKSLLLIIAALALSTSLIINDLGRGVSSHLGRRYNSGGICFRIDFRSNNRSCLYRSN